MGHYWGIGPDEVFISLTALIASGFLATGKRHHPKSPSRELMRVCWWQGGLMRQWL